MPSSIQGAGREEVIALHSEEFLLTLYVSSTSEQKSSCSREDLTRSKFIVRPSLLLMTSSKIESRDNDTAKQSVLSKPYQK